MVDIDRATQLVEQRMAAGIRVSDFLHANPELGFDEVRSSARIVDELREGGAAVQAPSWDLSTAFLAETGSGDRCLALFSEFDALPEVGHACGHNLIAGWSVVAFLALRDLGDELGIRIRLLGSPSEESGAGKQLIIDRGGLDGVDWAAMVHPAPDDVLLPNILAMTHYSAQFRGLEAHAAAFPWKGRNAGDAATLSQAAIGLLRQQLPPGDRVHTAHRGESGAVNVITDQSTLECMVRSRDRGSLSTVNRRVENCLRGAALATDSGLTIEPAAPDYANMKHDLKLAQAFRRAGHESGIQFPEGEELSEAGSGLVTISTDMGNVSHVVPSIHPMVGIPTSAVNHQKAFADACTGAEAERWIRRTAIATVLFAARLTAE